MGRLLHYTLDNAQRLAVVALCMPTMAILVGILKAQVEKGKRALEAYLDAERERNRFLSEALSKSEHLEGTIIPPTFWEQREIKRHVLIRFEVAEGG